MSMANSRDAERTSHGTSPTSPPALVHVAHLTTAPAHVAHLAAAFVHCFCRITHSLADNLVTTASP
jgi:hypothetical protein